ncbi:hypothetical protein [Leifsonia sp. RAF41]|uniref:hypothetical protein n=1 Tax=Leifsonia sp. RAF41 TaxID=3233056 RepID=UPI003F96AFB6
MLVTGSSQEGFDEALQDAISQQPTQGDVPRRYEIVRTWVDTGGIAGTWYRCDVAVTGPDVPDSDQG